ncbi:putative histidine protein methyltransferase 1 [Paratrimastix pyriformis]|uniref:protein-histidine N-methyltransferase n=1 Tax=Paratrimastix pyriformis TaxID=342808 RepID=A0ABQ8UBF5_9EUKA|nr:putative histidine protein methyltransferase 1 [Paratrimastix pyriformis]
MKALFSAKSTTPTYASPTLNSASAATAIPTSNPSVSYVPGKTTTSTNTVPSALSTTVTPKTVTDPRTQGVTWKVADFPRKHSEEPLPFSFVIALRTTGHTVSLPATLPAVPFVPVRLPTGAPLSNPLVRSLTSPANLRQLLTPDNPLKAILEHSDIVDGKYQGGFSLWECSLDLCSMISDLARSNPASFAGQQILELGCGHALPAILSLLAGAEKVVMQDYNDDVIRLATVPNVVENLKRVQNLPEPTALQRASEHCHFIAGDWASLSGVMQTLPLAGQPSPQFQWIFAAETIYSPSAEEVMLSLLTKHLAPGGTALFAAKTFYFGVGGGTLHFAQTLRQLKSPEGLPAFSVEDISTSSSMDRAILKIRRAN